MKLVALGVRPEVAVEVFAAEDVGPRPVAVEQPDTRLDIGVVVKDSAQDLEDWSDARAAADHADVAEPPVDTPPVGDALADPLKAAERALELDRVADHEIGKAAAGGGREVVSMRDQSE